MSRRDEAMEIAAAAEDAELRAAADRAVWRAWLNARDLERGYQLCPPADPAAPSVMVIVVENRSDKQPLIKACFRVPERTYVPRASVQVESRITNHESRMAK